MEICFCGIDGVGKSYYIEKIKERLNANSDKCRVHDPMKHGNNIESLLSRRDVDIPLNQYYSPTLISVAYAIDLNEAVKTMELKDINLIHRGDISCRVYAHMSGADMDVISSICDTIPVPELTVFMDIDPQLAYERIHKRNEKNTIWKETYANLCVARELFLLKYEQESMRRECIKIYCSEELFLSNMNNIISKIESIMNT